MSFVTTAPLEPIGHWTEVFIHAISVVAAETPMPRDREIMLEDAQRELAWLHPDVYDRVVAEGTPKEVVDRLVSMPHRLKRIRRLLSALPQRPIVIVAPVRRSDTWLPAIQDLLPEGVHVSFK